MLLLEDVWVGGVLEHNTLTLKVAVACIILGEESLCVIVGELFKDEIRTRFLIGCKQAVDSKFKVIIERLVDLAIFDEFGEFLEESIVVIMHPLIYNFILANSNHLIN
jgi:hypothetical protein